MYITVVESVWKKIKSGVIYAKTENVRFIDRGEARKSQMKDITLFCVPTKFLKNIDIKLKADTEDSQST